MALTSKIQADGFNQLQPLHDFCSKLNFQSYYQVAEQKEKDWLKHEELDDSQYPFKDIERFESTLFSVNGQVIIGNELVTVPKSTDADRSESCQNWYSKSSSFTYSYKKKTRKINYSIGILPFDAHASTAAYYKSLGSWWIWICSPSVELWGNGRQNYFNKGKASCSDQPFAFQYNSQQPWGFYSYTTSWSLQQVWAVLNSCELHSHHSAPGGPAGDGIYYCF